MRKLSGRNFTKADLARRDLSRADLSNANLICMVLITTEMGLKSTCNSYFLQ